MATVLHPRQRKQNFAEQFLPVLMSGLQAAGQIKEMGMKQEQEQEKKRIAAERAKALRKYFGDEEGVEHLPEAAITQKVKNLAPEKPETLLQKSQRELNEGRLKSLNEQDEVFNTVFKKPPSEQKNINEPQAGYGQETTPEENLEEQAAFAGQPGRRGVLGTMAKNKKEENIRQEDIKRNLTDAEKKQAFETAKIFHNETHSYDEKLHIAAKDASKRNRALKAQKDLIPKLTTQDRFAKALFGGTKWQNILTSKNAQEFDSYALAEMSGKRELLGGILSDSDIRLIMQKIATADKTPEANQAIVDYSMLENDLEIAREKIGDEIKKENKGFRPSGYEQEIERRLGEQYGDVILRSFDRLKGLKDNPKEYEKITGRKKVPPGTKLTNKDLDYYLDTYGNDVDAASEAARNDGYQF